MNKLPEDIDRKVNSTFSNLEENREVKEKLLNLKHVTLNVGFEQLSRAILVLSNGNMYKLREIFSSNFYGDPRDLIMSGEIKLGNPKHYFIPTFDEFE